MHYVIDRFSVDVKLSCRRFISTTQVIKFFWNFGSRLHFADFDPKHNLFLFPNCTFWRSSEFSWIVGICFHSSWSHKQRNTGKPHLWQYNRKRHNFHLSGLFLGFIHRIKRWISLVQHNKQHHKKVLPCSLLLKCHNLGAHPQAQKVGPPFGPIGLTSLVLAVFELENYIPYRLYRNVVFGSVFAADQKRPR